MILVDANLLIYAVNQDLPQHKQARVWWEQVLSGTARVGIPWVSAMAFLRICTNPRIFSPPLSPEAAIAYIDEWLDQPPVQLVVPGAGHWAILRNLLLQTGMAPISRPMPISPRWRWNRGIEFIPRTMTFSVFRG